MRRLSFRTFVKYAERLHGLAEEATSLEAARPYVIGSVLTSWISLESFVNNMMQDYAALPEHTFSIHEAAFLEETQVQFNNSGSNAGTFSIGSKPEFRRVEDKVLFLIAKFGGGKVDKGGRLWQEFEKVKQKRNLLTHHRRGAEIDLSAQDSQEALNLAKQLIEFLSKKIWKKTINW